MVLNVVMSVRQKITGGRVTALSGAQVMMTGCRDDGNRSREHVYETVSEDGVRRDRDGSQDDPESIQARGEKLEGFGHCRREESGRERWGEMERVGDKAEAGGSSRSSCSSVRRSSFCHGETNGMARLIISWMTALRSGAFLALALIAVRNNTKHCSV